MNDNKHIITFGQAKAAHARGVEVYTDSSDGSWFAIVKPPAEHCDSWTYALDRTPGRALTYDETCVHNDCGLNVELECDDGDRIIRHPPSSQRSKGFIYCVPLTEPAKGEPAQSQYEYVTGLRNVPEGKEKEWECYVLDQSWQKRGYWKDCTTGHTECAKFRRRVPAVKREAMRCEFHETVNSCGGLRPWLTTAWVGKRVAVTVREILPDAPPAVDLEAELRRVRSERDELQQKLDPLAIAAEALLTAMSFTADIEDEVNDLRAALKGDHSRVTI